MKFAAVIPAKAGIQGVKALAKFFKSLDPGLRRDDSGIYKQIFMTKIFITEPTPGIHVITLNRPECRNAFDDQLIVELIHCLKNFANASACKVLILKGAGKVFCAGADLHWMKRMADYRYEENVADADQLAELMTTLNAMPQLTMAAVQGAAYAGAIGLLSCCDMVFAESNAQFCLSEVKLGLIPAVIAPFVLSRIGDKAMRRYALTAEIFNAEEARAIGLVDEIVSSLDELDSATEALAKFSLKNSANAIAAMKKLMREMKGKSTEEARKLCVDAIAKQRVSDDAQERIQKFLKGSL